MPFGIKDYHKDINVIHHKCEKPRSYYIPFHDPEIGSQTEYDIEDRAKSGFFRSLCGSWDTWYNPNIKKIDDVFSLESKKTIVPMNWQMDLEAGYDDPIYLTQEYPFPVDPPYIPEENPFMVYSRDFNIPSTAMEKEVFVNFEGVDSCFYLFINGTFVSYSQVSHSTTEINITPYIKSGANTITLIVYKWSTGSYLECQDMWRMSGIFRDVYLLFREKERINDFRVNTTISDDFKSGTLTVNFECVGNPEINYKLLDKNGKIVFEGTCFQKLEANIPSVELWSDEEPTLYMLKLQCGAEYINVPVGFRKIEIINKVVYINGKKVKALGVNRHDSHHLLGHATPIEHIRRDLEIIKSHNCNMIRTSHYPSDPRFYLLCNLFGIYVCDEADLETHGMIPWNRLSDSEEWEEQYMDRANLLFQRDKNQPCVIMWSLGNESGYGKNHDKMAAFLREIDQSRLVHYENAAMFYTKLDNVTTAVTDMESRMYPRVSYCDEYCQNEKYQVPFFLCEYSHAMGNGPGDIKLYVEKFRQYDNFFGGCVWEFTDHSVAIGHKYINPSFTYGGDFGDIPQGDDFCLDGLVYPDRRLHVGIREMKQAYKPFKITRGSDAGEIIFKSYRLFKDFSDHILFWEIEVNGIKTKFGSVELNVKPEEEKTIRLFNPEILKGKGVITLNLYVKRITAENFAEPLSETGFEQIVLKNEFDFEYRSSDEVLAAIPDDFDNVVILSGESSITISKRTGMITSIKHAGSELLANPTSVTVWRAPISNERNIKSKYYNERFDKVRPFARGFNMEYTEERILIDVDLIMGAETKKPIIEATLHYCIKKDGRMNIKIEAKNHSELFLPRFGFVFNLVEGFEELEYFGKGPFESYVDKCEASRLGLFKTSVTENFEPYIRPQENGAHCGTHSVKVKAPWGELFHVEAKNPFSFNASHYTAKMLENAKHHYELVPMKETQLIIDYKQSGVGSNSCGPELLEEYRLNEKEFVFEFNFTFIRK